MIHINKKEYNKEYSKSEKGILAHQKGSRKYYQNNKEYYKKYMKKYRQKNKDYLREYRKLFNLKNKDKLLKYQSDYQNSEKGKLVHSKGNRKNKAKRRQLGFNPINEPFKDCNAHHINQNDVVYIPKYLHSSIYHNNFTGYNMISINSLAFTWYNNL